MSEQLVARPRRIRLSRARGWRMPDNTVKVDRSTPWGNPFKVGVDGTLVECLDLYKATLSRGVIDDLHLLRGKNLACWCRLDKPCHADVLLELASGGSHGSGCSAGMISDSSA
jgi:hypothetical protein